MRKLIVTVTAAMTLLICTAVSAHAEYMMLEYDGGTHEYNGEVYALVVNNQLINPPLSPIIFNDRALVPVREIFEEVGAQVNYINDTQTVEVIGDDTYVTLRINDNVAYVNGKRMNIPDNVVPKLIAKVGGETKTMVPVRFISESIGLDVEFDSGDGAILIESDGYTPAYDEPSYDAEPYEEEEYYEPEEPQLYVTDISYVITGDRTAEVSVTTDGDIDGYSDFVLSSPERLVLDIYGARLSGVPTNIAVNSAGISSIRLGDNDERARVVVDLYGLKKYSVSKTSANSIVIGITTNSATAAAAPAENQPAATPAPAKSSSDVAWENATREARAKYDAYSASSKLIVLDAGHGGSDSGAVGSIDGNIILEKNLTLEITNRVKTILENAGYVVEMTRTGDTLPSLQERPAQANAQNAAVFVSIHINSVDNAPDANGTEVFYSTQNNDDGYGTTSQRLASNILKRMLYYMNSTSRGVKAAEHAVTRRCNMPAALAEVGFITNPTEVYNMTTDEYQQKAAQGIAEGIMITLRDITVPE